jgi:hypothetical protein
VEDSFVILSEHEYSVMASVDRFCWPSSEYKHIFLPLYFQPKRYDIKRKKRQSLKTVVFIGQHHSKTAKFTEGRGSNEVSLFHMSAGVMTLGGVAYNTIAFPSYRITSYDRVLVPLGCQCVNCHANS